MKHLTRTLILVASLALLASIALAEDPWAEVDPSGQTVTFWYQYTRDREDAMERIIEDFNATNEYGITVDGQYQGGYGDIFQQMLVTLNTADVPDLVVAYQNQAATYQLGEGLIDMTSLIESPTWGLSEEEIDDFFAGFWESDVFPTFDNQRLGLAPQRSMEVMFYNRSWLEELGYDSPPQTPEEFREIACAAAETPYSNATTGSHYGYLYDPGASRMASWTFAFGGDIFDYEENRYTLNSEATVEAFTFLQELIADGCAYVQTESGQDQADFASAVTMFTVRSSSGIFAYGAGVDAGAGHEWSVAAVPYVTDEPRQNLYGASWSMPDTGSLERQLATWIFFRHFVSPDIQADWAMSADYFPARQGAAEALEDYMADNEAFATAFNLLPYSMGEPPVPGYDFVRDLMDQAMAAIAGGADVQATLDDLNEEANQILDEQLEEL